MKRAALPLLLLATIATANAQPVEPEPPPPPTPFDRGKFSLGGGAGSQTNLGYRYFVIGLGVGYFVLDGLEVGLSGLYQFGDGPSISQLSPSLRYVAQPLVGHSPVVPYAGVFYRHWFIGSEIEDVDTLGGRAGLLYVAGNLVLGLGVVVERTISSCEEDCVAVYPDFTISLAF